MIAVRLPPHRLPTSAPPSPHFWANGGVRVVAAVALFGGLLSWSAPPAQAAELLGYESYASAPGAELRLDQEGSIVNPLFQGRVPEATSELTSGPNGHGLASVFWPGSVGGNFGTTSQQINRLCVPQTPVPICVDITPEMKQVTANANDPYRAETFSPGGPAEASYPPGAPSEPNGALYMSSKAVDRVVTARAGMGSLNVPNVASGAFASSSTAVLSEAGDTISAAATTTGSGITVAGVVKIGSVTATATAKSDGRTATASSSAKVGDVSVNGIPATIDERGLTLQGANAPLGPASDPVLGGAMQALSQLQFKARVSKPTTSINGPQAATESGSVIIEFVMGGQLKWRILFGSATASVNASEGFTFDEVPPEEAPGDSGDGGGSEPPSPLGDEAAASFEQAGGLAGGPGSASGGSPIAGSNREVAFERVGATAEGGSVAALIVLLALGAAGFFGFGTVKLADDVLEEGPASCPLERRSL